MSVDVLLTFDMNDRNEALFLEIRFLFLIFRIIIPSTDILLFTTIYALL